MPPTLDVLMPHYNDPAGLHVSLNSIARQTWRGRPRVVIVDDGSSKSSLSQVGDLIRHSKLDIVLIEHGENRGRPFARNTLLDAIASDYVTWLDAGDEWYPRKLEIQFKTIERLRESGSDGFHWVTCDYDWRWDGGAIRAVRQVPDQDQLQALLVGRNLRAYLWTILGPADTFKKVGAFDEKLPRLQDLDYFVRFALKGGVLVNPERTDPESSEMPLCVYNKSDIGRNALEIRACNDHIFRKYRYVYERYGRRFVQGRLFEMDLLSARFAANNRSTWLTVRFLGSAIARKPLSFARRVIQTWLRRVGKIGRGFSAFSRARSD